jgi:geranylgeranyl pyrophosphate synthase
VTSTAPTPALARSLGWLAACERRLRTAVDGHVPEVGRPALDTLAAGGKRIRPLLVFCSAPREQTGAERVLATAAAVELVHMATLVHDDLLDGAPMRRGRPTVADAEGADVAIQTGDFLFARAFAELCTIGSHDAVGTLADAALALSRGEMDQQRAAFDLELSEQAYLSRCRRKTAALFSAACRLGSTAGGGGPEAAERLAAFGENVGLAFQIFDDILDIAGAPSETGKRRGTDLRDGTVTLPVILALQIEPGLARALEAEPSDAGLDELCDRLAAHRGLELARERALGFVAAARRALDGPVDGADTDALLDIADAVVDRYS